MTVRTRAVRPEPGPEAHTHKEPPRPPVPALPRDVGPVNFADGSELRLKYTGASKALATGKIENKGTAIVIAGKGRYGGKGRWDLG